MQRRSESWLEAQASSFRKKMNVETLQCPDVDSLIDRARDEYGIKFIRHFDDEMPNEQAFADSETRSIHYRESLRYELRRGDKRARFIFLEEMAHIILNHKGIRNRSAINRVYEKVNYQIRVDENEARRFAAAVLAPLDRIDPSWDALNISEFFQISLVAAEIRKEEADKFRRLNSNERRALPQCAIDFLKAAKERGYPVKSILD